MQDQFQQFINDLSSLSDLPHVFNQYAPHILENTIRRENLLRYLQQMQKMQPTYLLVGEAPGYRGCRLTGVPFTSEAILLEKTNAFGLFGAALGYQKTGEAAGLKKESTATILWEVLTKYQFVPLLWNAFPFHPHQPGDPESNRKPNKGELEIGRQFLKEIIRLFDIQTVVAIGGCAEETLMKMEVPCRKLRHPSRGGKAKFEAGIKALGGGV